MKRIAIVVEGNVRQEDRTIHELSKLVDKANSQPELSASMQTDSVDNTEDIEATFERAGGDDD
jgi:hypothetical protein